MKYQRTQSGVAECSPSCHNPTFTSQVANTTNEAAGDGTTTSTVLANAIFSEGFKAVTQGVFDFADDTQRELIAAHDSCQLASCFPPLLLPQLFPFHCHSLALYWQVLPQLI